MLVAHHMNSICNLLLCRLIGFPILDQNIKSALFGSTLRNTLKNTDNYRG
jgi:hypothetical protein